METPKRRLPVFTTPSTILQAAVMIACLGFISAGNARGFDHSYESYSAALKQNVSDGMVNYAGLKADTRDLNSFLADAATVSRDEFSSWTEERQLSYLINLYNAATLKLVTDNYPVKSIKDIGADSGGPWRQPVVRLFNQTLKLDTLENDVIRKDHDEPRVHFALVCAAKSCPEMIDRPYLPESLNEQLERQTGKFLSDTEKNFVNASKRTAMLSPLFDWYKEDFIKAAGSVAGFVNGYCDANIESDYKIVYTEYDWSLNDR